MAARRSCSTFSVSSTANHPRIGTSAIPGLVMAAIVLVTLASRAGAEWIQNGGVGPYEYTAAANWNGGTIDNVFSTNPTTGLNVTFNQDWTMSSAVAMSYAGTANLTVRSDSATARTITLAGNWTRTAGGGTITLGTVANPLVIDVNGATRGFGYTATAGNFDIYAKITNSSATAGGVTLGNGTGFVNLYNNDSDFNGPVSFLRRGGSFSSIKNVGGGPSALGAPTTAVNGKIYVADATSYGGLTYTGTGDTSDREWQWHNTAWSGLTHGGSGTLTLTGPQTWTYPGRNITGSWNANGGNMVISGVLRPSATQVNAMVFGSNQSYTARTITLGDNNLYTGQTTIGAVTLDIGRIGNVSGGASSLGAPASVATGTILIGATTNTGRLRYTGAGDTTDRVIGLAGTTGGAVIENNGAGALVFTAPSFAASGAGAKTLTLGGANGDNNEVRSVIVDNSPTNKTSVVKSGSGLWILSGANTYTGTTTVGDGTLLVNGTQAGVGAVEVQDGATLGGTGDFGAGSTWSGVTARQDGRIAPGPNADTLATGSLTLEGGSFFDAEMGPTAWDMLDVTGAVSLNDAILNLSTLGSLASYGGSRYVIVQNDDAGGIIDPVSGVFRGLDEGASLEVAGNQFVISYVGGTGNDVVLTSVPEPATMTLLALTCGGIGGYLRRRRPVASLSETE